MSIELLTNSVEFAKELAIEQQFNSPAPGNEVWVTNQTLIMLNNYLHSHGEDRVSYVSADLAFLIDGSIDLEFFGEDAIRDSRVEDPFLKGKVDAFTWLGSETHTGYGLRLLGVKLLKPYTRQVPVAFVPVETIDFKT